MTTNLLTGQTRNGLLFHFIKLCINDIFWSRVEFRENVHILVTVSIILSPMFNLFWLQLFLPKYFLAVNSLVLSFVDFPQLLSALLGWLAARTTRACQWSTFKQGYTVYAVVLIFCLEILFGEPS